MAGCPCPSLGHRSPAHRGLQIPGRRRGPRVHTHRTLIGTGYITAIGLATRSYLPPFGPAGISPIL